MNSSRKSSGLVQGAADAASFNDAIAYNVFLSTLAEKATAAATKQVDEATTLAGGLDGDRQRQALIKMYAKQTFNALKSQAALQGFVSWDIANAASFESMTLVDGHINETVQRVAEQIANGTLPLDINLSGSRTSARTPPVDASIMPIPAGPLTPSSVPDAGWEATERYTYIRQLGSGGFGKVFLVSDRLLGKTYAVKQIQLSEKATSKEIEDVVAEVRALAQMSHGNVVRLYSAWAERHARRLVGAESRDATTNAFFTRSDRFLGESDSPLPDCAVVGESRLTQNSREPCDSSHGSMVDRAGARARRLEANAITEESGEHDGSGSDDESSGESDAGQENTGRQRVAVASDSSDPFAPQIPEKDQIEEDFGIVFTTSITNSTTGRSCDIASSVQLDGQGPEHDLALVRRSRDDSMSAESASAVRNASLMLAPTARVLCYTMDFHPMNLEQYIFAYTREDEQEKINAQFGPDGCPGHCGHILPALDMISAVCDGLSHIHKRKYAHRDVKPANILISIHETRPDNASYVDLADCPDCRMLASHCGIVNLDQKRLFAVPHVTDFGTAVAIGCHKAGAYAGTKAYNPRDPTPTAKSDVYSLGVITLEMFSCPATASERMMVRNSMQVQGDYRDNTRTTIQAGVDGMTQKDPGSRWGMEEVRRWIEKLKGLCRKEYDTSGQL